MAARHVPKGRPVHDAEARGIQALVRTLPDNYLVFSNIELATDRRGQTFEHDAVVVAPHAVFTVELKSWGGRITGNRDRWTLADGTVVQSPIPLILSKARILKGRFQSRRRDLGSTWVQGIVFLSAADATVQITPDFEDFVVNLDGLRKALTDPAWLGHPAPITPAQRRAIEDFLNDGRPARVQDQLDDFRLLQRLPAEDRPYEAWLAERTSLTRERRVLHAYTITGETEAERGRLQAHALREATLHGKLRGGPDILRYDTYFITRDDPQRIVLQFEDTTPLQPIDVWVKDKKPGIQARLEVAARVARALAWVHEKGLVHRRLSPEAVLVSSETAPAEVRLCAFDLARDLTGTIATITPSPLNDPAFRCAAPEVLRTSEATARSDLFSLGATLVELFTGRPMFANADEVLRPFTVPPLHVGDRACPRKVTELVAELLAVHPSERPQDAAYVAEKLEGELRALDRPSPRTELAPDTVIRQTYELIARLGRGATATTWKARQLQTDHIVVLKIAGAEHAQYLQEEGRVLSTVHHPNLVRFHNVEPFDGGNLLVLEHVEGSTATLYTAAGDPLDPPVFLAVASGLLGALGALHQAGWVHRDVKPDNVMLTDRGTVPKLLDVGLAARWPVEGDLAVGSIRYKNPLVYTQGRWTPVNDLFSAFLVLYELLTGTHPFGGSPPEPNQRPTIVGEEFPESYEPAVVERLAGLFSHALSPDAADRPANAAAAVLELEQAIVVPVSRRSDAGPAVVTRTDSVPPAPLPATVDLGTPVADLGLSTRAQGALARLGVTVVADLVGLDVTRARGLPNVGSKSVRELLALSAEIEARWPGKPKAEPLPAERFYPALADDTRPLDDLGRDLTPAMKEALVARGVFHIGHLATMPLDALERLPFIGPVRMARLRAAMRRLAGREELPETLEELHGALKMGFREPTWEALAHVLGLHDGRARTLSEVAAALGVTRQRVSQAADLDPLRAHASVAQQHLLPVVCETMPPAGFAPLDVVADDLTTRLRKTEGGPSPRGYARLAGLLLRPGARATEAAEIRWVVRPPWTEEQIVELQTLLAAIGNWPVGLAEAAHGQVPRAEAEARLWDATPVEIQRALVRWGADAAQLLDALLKLDDSVLIDRVGGLYTPPVDLWAALSALRPRLSSPAFETATLLDEARAAYQGLSIPEGDDAVTRAIERAGYRRDGELWIDPARIELSGDVPAPRVDSTIPMQRTAGGRLPPVVETLASQAERGGFRVVALAPGVHHVLARRLAGWLAESLGQDRVQLLALDRLLIDALKAADLWKFVPYLEARPDGDWRMFHADVTTALDEAVQVARPGRVTVLGQPSLLGPLGLMDWLSGFYERARGGKHGLVVLTVPGGIHQDRVRLNEKYNLPYTPDMAAVYLEAS